MRNATNSNRTDLGELEQQILDLVWQFEPCQAEAIREKLDRPLKDSTVRTVLRRLEQKGLVRHKVENRTFLYRAAVTRQQVAAEAVKQILDQFCEGSLEYMLVSLVECSVADRHELKRLAKKIVKAKES